MWVTHVGLHGGKSTGSGSPGGSLCGGTQGYGPVMGAAAQPSPTQTVSCGAWAAVGPAGAACGHPEARRGFRVPWSSTSLPWETR